MIEIEQSRAKAYLLQKGWRSEPSGVDQAVVRPCPIGGEDDGKFYINISGSNKDGLWQCFKCNEAGNLYKLQELQGDRVEGIHSTRDAATSRTPPPPLPDVASAHRRLMEEDGEALEYVAGRGFSTPVIEKMKLGVTSSDGKTWLVIPYINKGNLVFVKYRSLPPADKEFRASPGREVPLYNEDVLQKDMASVVFVEGEADCLALLSAGYETVVGVPGAKIQKASWIEKLDRLAPQKIYLLYDNDKVGQDAAREMAKRIGIDKCFNVLLPDQINETKVKDINEWLVAGGTIEQLQVMLAEAQPFPVEGVRPVIEVLDDLEREVWARNSVTPTYDTPWPGLNSKLGFERGDVFDVLAEAKIGKTTFALNQAEHIVQKYNESVLFYCLEMNQLRMTKKWLSLVTSTDVSPPKNQEDGQSKLDAIKLAIPRAKELSRSREADLLFAYNSVREPEQAFDTIRQAVRRYGVSWVVFDNLQLLCDSTLKSLGHRTVHLSQISKQFKLLATDLNIVLLRVIQPNRVREGEIAHARNADGASQIEKDCDSMISLHRSRRVPMKASDLVGFHDEDDSLEAQMHLSIELSRYSGGGFTTLWFDGAYNRVREVSDLERSALPVPQNTMELAQETVSV